jgi:hypothetical protein
MVVKSPYSHSSSVGSRVSDIALVVPVGGVSRGAGAPDCRGTACIQDAVGEKQEHPLSVDAKPRRVYHQSRGKTRARVHMEFFFDLVPLIDVVRGLDVS